MTIIEKSDEGPVENKVLDCKFVVFDFVEDSSGMHRFGCSKMPVSEGPQLAAGSCTLLFVGRSDDECGDQGSVGVVMRSLAHCFYTPMNSEILDIYGLRIPWSDVFETPGDDAVGTARLVDALSFVGEVELPIVVEVVVGTHGP